MIEAFFCALYRPKKKKNKTNFTSLNILHDFLAQSELSEVGGRAGTQDTAQAPLEGAAG